MTEPTDAEATDYIVVNFAGIGPIVCNTHALQFGAIVGPNDAEHAIGYDDLPVRVGDGVYQKTLNLTAGYPEEQEA